MEGLHVLTTPWTGSSPHTNTYSMIHPLYIGQDIVHLYKCIVSAYIAAYSVLVNTYVCTLSTLGSYTYVHIPG